MKSYRRQNPKVNAGSMADIAFLLLIFFLVTTTIAADKGILRKLPKECPPGQICDVEIHERNILRIVINDKQQIMIEDSETNLNDVKAMAMQFLDNNGSRTCDYCSGLQNDKLSDHPQKAVISLQYGAMVKYDLFIQLQDELTKAYYELRAQYALNTYNKTEESLTKYELEAVKKAYPFILSEVSVKR